MPSHNFLLYGLIVGCEVAFWLVLVAALAVRYLLRRESLSRWMLWLLPAIDLALLGFTALDLVWGESQATFAHGLATAYVGFTVTFGAMLVRWADVRFAHYFAGGPAPPPPARSWQAVREELWLWLRSIVAWCITLGLLTLLIGYVGVEEKVKPLYVWYRLGLGGVFFWFLFGPLWSLVFFQRERTSSS